MTRGFVAGSCALVALALLGSARPDDDGAPGRRSDRGGFEFALIGDYPYFPRDNAGMRRLLDTLDELKITDNTYTHYADSRWVLGRLDTATVTHRTTGLADGCRFITTWGWSAWC